MTEIGNLSFTLNFLISCFKYATSLRIVAAAISLNHDDVQLLTEAYFSADYTIPFSQPRRRKPKRKRKVLHHDDEIIVFFRTSSSNNLIICSVFCLRSLRVSTIVDTHFKVDC